MNEIKDFGVFWAAVQCVDRITCVNFVIIKRIA